MRSSKTSPQESLKNKNNQKFNLQRSSSFKIIPNNSESSTLQFAHTPDNHKKSNNIKSYHIKSYHIKSTNLFNNFQALNANSDYKITLSSMDGKPKATLYLKQAKSNYHKATIASSGKEAFSYFKLPKKIEKNSIVRLYNNNGVTKTIVAFCEFNRSTDVDPGKTRPKKGGKGH